MFEQWCWLKNVPCAPKCPIRTQLWCILACLSFSHSYVDLFFFFSKFSPADVQFFFYHRSANLHAFCIGVMNFNSEVC